MGFRLPLPALGSRYADSIERRQRKLSQRIETSRQCPRNWCKSSNFLHSPIAQLAEYLTVNQSVPGSSPGGGVGSDPAITSRALLPTKT